MNRELRSRIPVKGLLPLCCAALSGLLGVPNRAAAAPELKWQVDQHGGFALIGNALSQQCSGRGTPPEIPAPVVGAVAECSATDAAAPALYYRSDDPSAGDVRVDSSVTTNDARSSAVLQLPSAATVTHARLYWGSYANNETPDCNVHIARPSSGLDTELTPDRVWSADEHADASGRMWHQAAADVTDLVSHAGAGTYRVGDFVTAPEEGVHGHVGWYLVVFYKQATEPQRNLALFEGLELVQSDSPTSITLSGFHVSKDAAGYDTRLGVAAFAGDAAASGDSLSFEGTLLADAQNPIDNFFNGTRSYNGKPVSTAGDLPQLTGEPRSLNGLDLDVVDITYLVKADQSSAALTAKSTHETYLLGAFIMSSATPADSGTSDPGTPSSGTHDDTCDVDADCHGLTPYCDFAQTPQVCVACVTSRHCKDPDRPDCSPKQHICECAAGSGHCQTDSDDDGISDEGEKALGTDPHDSDSDDDGTPDGDELDPNVDTDGDGLTNAHDPDSDNDGLFDGTEQGFDCSSPGTDLTKHHCRADADDGATRTNPVVADTDHGGVSDGDEDTNLNGRVDPGETDPTPGHGNDDYPPDHHDVIGRTCNIDADCGTERSGLICKVDKCVSGCRGTGGNRCPAPQTCSSHTSAAGSCETPPGYVSDVDGGIDDELRHGVTVNAVSKEPVPVKLYGGGGRCNVVRVAAAPRGFGAGVYWLALLGWFVRRRSKR